MRYLETGGEVLAVSSELSWVADLLEEGADGALHAHAPASPSVHVLIERSGRPFAAHGWERLTWGAARCGAQVVVEDVCATGFDLHARIDAGVPRCDYRYRPRASSRATARVLRRRFVLLVRALLLQYPVIWSAGARGRAPLHVAACTAGRHSVLLAGPAGVGKSTLVARELEAGGVAASDNLSVSDGGTVWGVVEPLRTDVGTGRSTTRGRHEQHLGRRVPVLTPTTLVLLRAGIDGTEPVVGTVCAAEAAGALEGGTYMAGELRRYWGFVATLVTATGLGPVHPPVGAVSWALATRLPALEIQLPARPGLRLADVLDSIGDRR